MKVQTALADFDEDINIDGSQKYINIKFWLNDGTAKHIPRGIKCGVNNNNMGETDTKGIQPVDKFGNAVGHPIPFKWYKVFEYQSKTVEL